MAGKQSLKKNFAFKFVYDLLIIILPFVTAPYLGRVLGAENLGTYSYYFTIGNYFVLLSLLGLRYYGNRTIAACREDRSKLDETFSGILCAHIGVSLICIFGYALFTVLYLKNDICALIMGLTVLSGLFDISWFYFGLENFKFTVSSNLVVKILTFISILTFVNSREDLWIYTLIMSAGILLSQLILWFPLRRFVTFRKPSWPQIAMHFRPMLVLFIPVLAVSLYKMLNKIMLTSMSDMEQLGFYDNAEKVIILPMTLITSFSAVMLPRMANIMAGRDHAQAFKYIEMSFFVVMWLVYACAFGLAGISDIFAPVFWGDEFYPAGLLIAGLCASLPFMAFADVIRQQYLIPGKKDREYISSVAAGALVSPILNLLLIPRYQALGAVIATIITEAVVCTVQVIAVRKELTVGRYFRQTVLFIPFGAAMMLGIYELGEYMGRGVMTLIAQLAAGVIFYIGISLPILWFKRKDYPFLEMLRRRKKPVPPSDSL